MPKNKNKKTSHPPPDILHIMHICIYNAKIKKQNHKAEQPSHLRKLCIFIIFVYAYAKIEKQESKVEPTPPPLPPP